MPCVETVDTGAFIQDFATCRASCARSAGAASPDLTEGARNAVGDRAWQAVSIRGLGQPFGMAFESLRWRHRGDSFQSAALTTERLLMVSRRTAALLLSVTSFSRAGMRIARRSGTAAVLKIAPPVADD